MSWHLSVVGVVFFEISLSVGKSTYLEHVMGSAGGGRGRRWGNEVGGCVYS